MSSVIFQILVFTVKNLFYFYKLMKLTLDVLYKLKVISKPLITYAITLHLTCWETLLTGR